MRNIDDARFTSMVIEAFDFYRNIEKWKPEDVASFLKSQWGENNTHMSDIEFSKYFKRILQDSVVTFTLAKYLEPEVVSLGMSTRKAMKAVFEAMEKEPFSNGDVDAVIKDLLKKNIFFN